MSASRLASKMGTYVLGERLGAGGMAEVFVAEGIAGEKVAIKRILPGLARDAEFCEMFWDEARVMSRLEHPNVVRVLDYGADDGQLFIALEFVDGPSVARLLRKAAREKVDPSLPAIAHVGSELLAALDFVHHAKDAQGRELHIVHRDVSPGNVLLTTRGDVKLGDFGIVRSSIVARRTMPGELKGKLGYMSPEQAMGDPLGPMSDLFSVAVILAELLILRPLFLGKNEMDTLSRTVNADLSTWHRYNGSVPLPVRAVIEKALARKPADRFASAREMRQAWLGALRAVQPAFERRDLWEFLRKLELSFEDARDVSGERPLVPRAGEAPSKPPEGAIPVRRISSKEIPAVRFEALAPSGRREGLALPVRSFEPARIAAGARAETRSSETLVESGRAAGEGDDGLLGLVPVDAKRRLGRPVWSVPFSRAKLPGQLFLALRRVRTGNVELTSGGRTLRLEVVDGRIVCAHDSEGTAPLGRLLLDEGTIERSELVRAIGESRRAGLRLGEYLVLGRRIRESALARLLRTQFEIRLGSWVTKEEGVLTALSSVEGKFVDDALPESFAQVVFALRKALTPELLPTFVAPFLDAVLLPTGMDDESTALGLLGPEARVLASVLEGGALEGKPMRTIVETLTTERLARAREVEFALLVAIWVGTLQASA